MSTEEIAIKVENVDKVFRLPHEKTTSIKSSFINFYRQKNTYEKQQALKDVSFTVKKGEFFGIVGRNGSGKSTLLKILAGIYQPTKGKVSTNGKLVPFIELGVGFNPELTGRDNLYLNGALLGFSRKEVHMMYDDIVKFAELEKFMDQKLKNYSSGMEVRLAFSLATRAKADILLIDEVLAVGDADFQRKCFNYFSQLRKGDTTVIFVSHDMGAIREYCDRALLIENNQVLAIGQTDEVAEKYMRLFMDEKENEEKESSASVSKDGKRWGDEAMKFTDVSVKVNDKKIVITEKIKALRSLERPIVGFRIRDAAGNHLTGTNTKVENKHLPDFKKGQTLVVTWEFPNLLSDGQYSIDPAILHADEITVADWWNDALTFKIRKDRHLPYNIDPGFSIKTEISN